MDDAQQQPQSLTLMAKLVLGLAALLLLAGVARYGVTLETLSRIVRDIFDRPEGPLSFRFILQPTMATLGALHHGIKDARTGRSPYFWAVLHKPEARLRRLDEALVATGRVVLIGIVIDTVYQYREFGRFYPAEAVIVTVLLAFIPYVALRGPIARVARWWIDRH